MDPKTGQLAEPEDFEPETTVEEKPPAGAPPKNPRDLALAEMAKRANARRTREEKTLRVDTLEEDGTITPASVPMLPELTLPEAQNPDQAAEATFSQGQTDAAAEISAVPTPAAPAASAPPTAPEEERELIVEGKRIRVPVSKIIDAGTRTLQKESAADMRLAAATELLRSAQEQRQAPPAAQQPAPQPSDEDAVLARSIQFGTEEEARTAIAKLRNATPAITPQQIAAYVQQSLAQTLPDHTAFHEANRWLRTEYSEITSDPDLKLVFDLKEDQARKAGDRRPYRELYADLAGQIATKFHLKKAERPEPPQPMNPPATQAPSDRIVRKASSPRPVTGASGRMEQAQAPAKPQTVSDYVTRQRQLRGLQPLDKQAI